MKKSDVEKQFELNTEACRVNGGQLAPWSFIGYSISLYLHWCSL